MKFLAIHHTAVARDRQPSQLHAVNRYHKGKWGMVSSLGWYVGYNYFCDVNGKRTNARKIGEETIANRGHNCDVPERCDTISYCMAGNFNFNMPTNAQIRDCKSFIEEMRAKYPDIEVVRHRDIQSNTMCAGSLITKEWIKAVLLEQPEPSDEVEREKAEKIEELSSLLVKLQALLKRLLFLRNQL